ncbi:MULTISPECIES: hypothetical protein [unclassified Nocardiopsis]|uniref:hypothetical protein n=1 Tax=unclassified Nocardiopsis TaxID=2649073 RepID=UPI001359F59C|nr:MULTISPECIES: hypothetical protein [unclassified Nocardiopsis]
MTSEPGKGLSAFPEGMNRDGSRIHDAADYTDEINAWYTASRAAMGIPWGTKGEYAEQMAKIFVPLEENFRTYLDFLVRAQRDAADRTMRTAGNFGNAEEENVDISSRVHPGTGPGSGGRR